MACYRDIAAGLAQARDCRRLIDPDLPENLRFARCGQHFIVFVEAKAQVIIIDLLLKRTHFLRRLSGLGQDE